MAIIIAYDDSDGWYDHVMPPVVNESQTAYDFLSAPDNSGGQSGTNAPLGGYQGRFSFGPRMPLIVISPFAKENYVDHTVTDQSSIVSNLEGISQQFLTRAIHFDAASNATRAILKS